MPRISKPAPIAKPKSFRTTDATPKKPMRGGTAGKIKANPKVKIEGKAYTIKNTKPGVASSGSRMVKGKVFKATSTSTPVMPSSSKKLGKMNRGAY